MVVHLTNLSTGAVAQNNVTYDANLPANNVFLFVHAEIGQALSGVAAQLELVSMSLVTNPSISNSNTFSTIADMRSTRGPFSVGDITEVSGYAAIGDGGGGTFYFEGTPPDSATITKIVSTTTGINEATNETPIKIRTSSPHGLQTGDAVLILDVIRNEAANGRWLVTVVDPIHFTLKDSRGNGYYSSDSSGGHPTVTTATVTTKNAHGLLSGATVMIAGLAGATSANLTFFPVGYVSDTSFTIPCGALSDYTSGGIHGDGGVSVPSTAGTSRWIRRVEGSRYDARWFGAVADGWTDHTPALSGATKAAHAVSRTATLPAGKTYLISRELDMSPVEEVGVEGESTIGFTLVPPTVIKANNAGMRSVIAMGNGAVGGLRLKGLRIDANRMATYGVFFRGAPLALLEDVSAVNAVKDGFFLSPFRDDGTRTYNDNIVLKNCSAQDCGTVYQTKNLKDDDSYPAAYKLNRSIVPGTVSIEAGQRTVTGVDTEFRKLGARAGDFIRIGRGRQDQDPHPSVVEIEEVVSDYEIKLYTRAVATKHDAADYAVAVGDGWHEASVLDKGEQIPARDNNRAYIEGGHWHRNAGCTLRCRGAYGPIILHPNIALAGMYGIGIGSGDQSTGVITSVIIGPYFEGSGAVHGCIRSEAAFGLSIINPMWDNAADGQRVITGFQAHNVHTFYDYTGVAHFGGTHEYRNVNSHEHTIAQDHPQYHSASGMTTGLVRCFTQHNFRFPAVPAWEVKLPMANHTGKILLDLRATYRIDPGIHPVPEAAPFTGGSKVVEVSYTWNDKKLTLGTLDDLTPMNQRDPTLEDPIFKIEPFGKDLNLVVSLLPTKTIFDGGVTFWAGEGKVIRAGSP